MTDKRLGRTLLALAAALILSACATAGARPQREAMIAAADQRAVDAGLTMLRQGGSATDAAIATMLVLGLVEPQSAGLGGGGFLLTYDARSEDIEAFDGRERAPAAATPQLFLQPNGSPLSFFPAAHSGLSVGTPALVPMLKLAHERHGRLPWAALFQPAIQLAEEGFVVSPRLAGLIAAIGGDMRNDPAARAYFFDEAGQPLATGARRTNPEYAATLRAIAAQGPRAMTQGPIAESIIAAVGRGPRSGALTLTDLENYAPRKLDPVCGMFRTYRVCGMPPPSSGGGAVLAILGLYERARPVSGGVTSTDDWSAFLWASRLAYADRDYYIADDEFVPVPAGQLVAPRYLDARAAQIDVSRAPSTPVRRGDPSETLGGQSLAQAWGADATRDQPGTTHLSIVDFDGNAVALTASVEAPFGAQRMAAGFLLNNQLTDFSLRPEINGQPVANAPAPRKRPRSSMAPTIVTDQNGELVAVIGSPGGSGIIAYVARTLIGALDWGQTMQDAVSTGNVVAQSRPARLETSRLPPHLQAGLAARGWALQAIAQEVSGLHGIRVKQDGTLEGGADPRREGVVATLAPPAP